MKSAKMKSAKPKNGRTRTITGAKRGLEKAIELQFQA